MYIENINSPKDIKKLSVEQLSVLAEEVRTALIRKLSEHGGHIGPNLGMVETTIALHYVFNSPIDKIVFDVSHQSYVHKMLTGRMAAFLDPAKYDDVTGYTNPDESEHDFFTIGHTSTSVSLAMGLAKGRDLTGGKENIIAVIGDGSLSGGEALEGLNNAAMLGSNMIIIVNDNDQSIAENHGGLYSNLKLLRETNGQAECNLFKAMGLDYVYVDHGNDLRELIGAFKQVKDSKKPVVVHINTLKGKGYKPAEEHKEEWHWHLPFDIETGKSHFPEVEDYSSVTCEYLIEKMKKDPTVVAITSGTPTILGFTQEKRKQAGRQFVDVGIAEETAVALASGIAKGGGKPVYGVYSSFIQRTYDQISQDLCIDGNPATIVVYTGSVFGMTDVTHLGLQDIPMLSNIPGLVYLAPTTKEEYLSMLDWSVEQKEMPVAIKLPGGDMISDGREVKKDWSQLNTYEVTEKGSKIALIGLGTFYSLALQTAEMLEKKGIHATVINPYYITGLDEGLLEKLKADHDTVVTLEDGILNGGFGEKIARFYGSSDMKVYNYGLKKEFLDRYDVNEVLKENHLTAEQIVNDVL